MKTKNELQNRSDLILRWTINIFSLLLFALWGTFFIEHLGWFKSSTISNLPLTVWLVQLVHLALLAGYLMIFKWPRPACYIIIISALIFFASTAGQNFLFFTLISILPVILYIILWVKKSRVQPGNNAA